MKVFITFWNKNQSLAFFFVFLLIIVFRHSQAHKIKNTPTPKRGHTDS